VFEKAAYPNKKDNMLFDLKVELAKYAEKIKQPIISAVEYVKMENDETTGNDITDEEIHYLELLRYFESHSDYYNENDLEIFFIVNFHFNLLKFTLSK
jgi:hypothetical protein